MYQTAENASLQSIEPIILIKLTNNNYEFLNGKTKITIDNEGNIININTNAKYYPYVKSGKISYIISFDEIMQQLKKDTNATTLKKIFNTETTDIKKIKQYDEEFIDIYLNYINTNSEVLENKPVKLELKKNNEEI